MSALCSQAELLDVFERRLEDAARGEGRALVSATVQVDPSVDPSAVVVASRRSDDRWFCWEQPDREGLALAALGTAHAVSGRGEDRFSTIASECAALGNRRLPGSGEGLPPGAGALWTGGFAFADNGGGTPDWSSLPPALMVLPELSILRARSAAYLTVNAVAGPGSDPAGLAARLRARLGGLREVDLPLLDPAPTGRFAIAGARPAGAFENAVERAVERIRSGTLEKVVLAREVIVEAPCAYDPGSVFGALREVFPSCFCFCVGTPEAAFIGASPELLVRRSGAGAATVALAGSTRRSADPSVDDHLGERLLHSAKERQEHAIVARRIERALSAHAVWVAAAPEPELVRVANIQHLATPIRAQLAEPLSALGLVSLLHPTPAVGGEPWPPARSTIEELEQMDRGWYAGPVGWMDATEDGEFCVALRSALLRDRIARLYAGAGVVADSDPQSELAETEVKLQALLPLLTG